MRVVIIDDEPLARRGIRVRLERLGDVDIVAEKPKKVVELFHRAFPHLRVEDHPVVVRFKDGEKVAIDVIKPTSSPLFKRILKLTESLKVQQVLITLADSEALIALKFQAMASDARANHVARQRQQPAPEPAEDHTAGRIEHRARNRRDDNF